MALALPLLVGLAVAPLLGGRWSRLAEVRLRWAALFYGGLAVRFVAFPAYALPWRTPDRVAVVLWILSYVLLAVAVGRNLRVPGIPLVAVGLVANLAAILRNGGQKPALTFALCDP